MVKFVAANNYVVGRKYFFDDGLINDIDSIEILNNYESMIDEKEYDKELLGELNVYDEIYKQPNRKKCALLPFESLRKVIDKM